MEKEIKLKPCPFCGGEALLEPCFQFFHVVCFKCGSAAPGVGSAGTKEGAIKAWNKRAHEKEIAKLKEEIKFLEDKIEAIESELFDEILRINGE